jgi:peptidoglycan/LPS O-acetylase OafA/YrhL
LPRRDRGLEHLGTRRFGFVDALRGIAALSVAAYHIDRYGPLPGAAAGVVPKFINSALHHGWVGVQMFFVISGFVIAYTLRGVRITPSSLGNFALRRSLRLDPPYWVTMLFVIGLCVLTTSLFDIENGLMDEAPTWDQVLAHLFYLQNILGYHNLSAGFWTLCIEVQFYLLFALLLGFAQRLTAHCSDRADGAHWLPLLLTYAPLAIASLFWFSHDQDNTDWVVHFFAFFFFGAMAWWTLEGRMPKPAFWAFAGAILIRQWIHGTFDMWVALATGLAIYAVISTGRSDRWLRWRWLQRLGLISYSLYLIHYPVSWIITTLGYELTGTAPVAAVFWLVLSLAASIGVANALYAAVELPAIRFARRFGGASADRRRAGTSLPILAEPLR